MYLKSLEVQGFKSFAHKMLFEFHQGITGIVGPNGSGKSNVADAVRWVLGEQSARQLRGGNMQDVIFAGTETRKMQSFASVAITLDNSDHCLDISFDEVKITRRLYRSGESEYMINDSPVRLKDINELFYDTGIGKEGYSIIGQGQIEQIISSKPEDRRELFDEAAGIVKFKRRKVTAVKKLDEEQQNLIRVNDILNEITSQLAPLQKQSEAAKVYLDKRQELKELDINMFLIETEHIFSQLSDVAKKSKTVEDDTAQAQKSFGEMKDQYERLESDMEKLDSEIAAIHDEVAQSTLTRQRLTSRIDVLNEQINTIRTSDETSKSRRDAIAGELKKRQAEKDQHKEEEKTLTESYSALLEEKNAEEKKFASYESRLSKLTSEIEDDKKKIIDLLNNRSSVKGRKQRYDTMLEQIDIRKAEIASRALILKQEEEETRVLYKDTEESLRTVSREIDALKADIAKDDELVSECQKEIAEGNHNLDIGSTTYHREASRLESLKNLMESYDGYGNGIRRVMEEKPNVPGIKGVVAELLTVDKKYELAIETALGAKTRNVVTDDEATAKKMIEFLKKNRLGRATFLPLSSMREVKKFEQERALGEPGVIGLASSLVSTDPGYASLAPYLLGRTLVVDEINHAIALGNKYRHGLYMVTLQGELFTPGGAITGGAFKNNSTLLGRKREIDELTVNVANLKKEMDDMQRSVEEKRSQRNAGRDEIVELQGKLQDACIRQNTASMQLRQADEKLKNHASASEELSRENHEILSQIEEVRGNNSNILEEISDSEKTEKELTDRTEEMQKDADQLSAEKDKESAVLENLHVKEAGLKQKRTFIAANLERVEGEIESLQREDELLVTRMDTGDRDVKEKLDEIDEAKASVEKAENDSDKSAEKEKELQLLKQKMNEDHKGFFAKREEVSERLSLLDKESFRLNSQKERLEENRDQQISYLFEEYETTPSEAKKLRNPDLTDRSALKKKVASLKDEIRSLGTVNVNAIEDYKALSERHTFLSTQHDDLVKSEETLLHIIDELDQGMRRQFKDKFADINKAFDKVFKELFGGGSGSLMLEEDVDVLEAGVNIISQPPGKKLQNMMQLSGGEKSLTAIALLFAIQDLKPSPFCLLDEIEAALDDPNVLRFAKYLHKLSANTQFIVITHRRGTMTEADRLYGITMQEKGVSALVSVNLIEDKLN